MANFGKAVAFIAAAFALFLVAAAAIGPIPGNNHRQYVFERGFEALDDRTNQQIKNFAAQWRHRQALEVLEQALSTGTERPRVIVGCEREYGADAPGVFECTMSVLKRREYETERQKTDRVYRSSY